MTGVAPAVAGARLGGLRETAPRRTGAGARVPGSLHASGGDLERASRRHGRDDDPFPRARDAGQARAPGAGGGVHRSLLLARLAERLQADSALWSAGSGGEGHPPGVGTAGLVGTGTRSGDYGDGGGLPAARRSRRVGALHALPCGAIRSDGGDSAPASGDAAEHIGSRTAMRTAGQGRGASAVALGDAWGSRPPGADASARRRSHGLDPGLPQPDGPFDSGEAPATTRKALVNPAPARPNPTRGLTQAAGRLQSPSVLPSRRFSPTRFICRGYATAWTRRFWRGR